MSSINSAMKMQMLVLDTRVHALHNPKEPEKYFHSTVCSVQYYTQTTAGYMEGVTEEHSTC